MTTQLAKWGNSLALRIPKAAAAQLNVQDGDSVDVTVQDGAIVIRPVAKKYSVAELVDGVTAKNRHRAVDWGAPAGNEAW